MQVSYGFIFCEGSRKMIRYDNEGGTVLTSCATKQKRGRYKNAAKINWVRFFFGFFTWSQLLGEY